MIDTPLSTVVVTCSLPPIPTNGQRSSSQRNYNISVDFSCNTGYILRGNSSRTCQSTGQWSGTQPTCDSKLFCPPRVWFQRMNDINCSHVMLLTTLVNHRMWFSFLMLGSCGTPRSLTNGQTSYTSTTVGSIVTYTCDPGYMMTAGNSSRTCQSDGLWSGNLPTCTRKSTLLLLFVWIVFCIIGPKTYKILCSILICAKWRYWHSLLFN